MNLHEGLPSIRDHVTAVAVTSMLAPGGRAVIR
jgi:hypothetical protein